jgi:aryl-alcohol dehydrogenase-like predicted oxidoreductase
MKYRSLGRTNLQLSEIGFGGWGIGNTSWVGADDLDSLHALTAARDAGVNFFDTALVYGRGHSERLIGQLFGDSKEIIIASKVPPLNSKWPAPAGVPLCDVFPIWHILECLRKTCSNLQREVLDLYQFHVWSDEWVNDLQWLEIIYAIRRSERVRFIGISINDHQPTNVIKALESGLIDFVQVIYNIFDQSPADELFPYCLKNRIGIIVRVPFDEGGLTGTIQPGTAFPSGDFRNRYFGGSRKQEVWDRVQCLVSDVGIDVSQLPTLALRFCLSHPAVTTVIPGMRKSHHVRRNTETSEAGALSQDLLDKLSRHRWRRNYYDPPAASDEVGNTSLSRVQTLVPRLMSIFHKER